MPRPSRPVYCRIFPGAGIVHPITNVDQQEDFLLFSELADEKQ
jgi:hypothetical protein